MTAIGFVFFPEITMYTFLLTQHLEEHNGDKDHPHKYRLPCPHPHDIPNQIVGNAGGALIILPIPPRYYARNLSARQLVQNAG